MNVTPNHTATPWRAECWTCHAPVTVLIDDASDLTGKRVVAECEREEDAAFIVRACNAFDSMHLALVMVADTIPFQFMEPEIRKLVMDALDAARPK
jgi:hypothetical protein